MVPVPPAPRARRRTASAPDALVMVDARSAVPLYRQIYESFREAILSGRLAPGARVPSSRVISRDLGVSRNTVALAMTQLAAEGYVRERLRVGTFVAPSI